MKQGDIFNLKYTVTDEVYLGFRNTFKQENPFHTDDTAARTRGYKAMIMPGNLLNGLISNFVGEHLPLKDVLFHSIQTSFLLPVYLHDELEMKAEIVHVSESVNVYEFKGDFRNQDGKKVARFIIQLGMIK